MSRRYPVENGLVPRGIVAQRLGVVGLDISGGDRVDVDAPRTPFAGQQLGQTGHAAFAGGIGRDADAALKRQQRSDVDDLARSARHHLARNGLAQEKQRFQVHVHHRIPVVLGEIQRVGPTDDTGVVHQNIDVPGPLHPLRNDPPDRFKRPEVGLNRQRTIRVADLRQRIVHRRPSDAGDPHPGTRQIDGERLTKAGIRAGHDGRFAGQVEQGHRRSPMSTKSISVKS